MNQSPPSLHDVPRRGGTETGIDAELVRRIAEGDPQASAAFLAIVHDRACQLVREALTGSADRQPPVVVRLIRAYQHDDLQIQAALLSAQTSFRRQLTDLALVAEVKDDREYVTALITLAYNHWQRRKYRDKQLLRQTALGSSRNGQDDPATVLSRAADTRPGPEHRPMIDDFYEKLVEEIHLMCRELKPGEARVVELRLFQGMTYEQIAREVGKSTASAHRICQQMVAYLQRRFRDSAP
jgi:RNA polymerase sigma factor (sigma-70 family)